MDWRLPGRVVPAGLVLSLLLAAGSAHAALLNLPQSLPDITSENLDIVYDAGVEQLTVTGSAASFVSSSGSGDFIPPLDFSLTASIDNAGVFSSGSFAILDGMVTLLSGVLVDFGLPALNLGVFEFLANVDAVAMSAPWNEFGSKVGIVVTDQSLNGQVDFSAAGGGFDNLFMGISGTGLGMSNTFATPEPGVSALLAAGGLLVLAAARSRRRRSRKPIVAAS